MGVKQRLEMRIRERFLKDPSARIFWWNGVWWTSREVLSAWERCVSLLREAGFVEGSRMALFLSNSPVFHLLTLAVWELGGTVVPLNSRGGTEGILRILRKIDPFGVILSSEDEALEKACREEGFAVTICSTEDLPESFEGRPCFGTSPEMAVFFATSGTTGDPKVVPLTHHNIVSNARELHENIEGFEEGRILCNVLPNFHSFGFTVCGVTPLLFGLPQVLLPSFFPVPKVLEALEATETETLIAVPTMLPFLLGAVEKRGKMPESLTYLLTGGGALEVSLEKRIEERLGVTIFQGYGLTECSPVVSGGPGRETKKPGTVGPPLPGYSLEVRDKQGRVLPPGEEGLLWLKGPSVCSGYFHSSEQTSERFSRGWFNTGDIVRLDEDGYISVLDRESDLIIVGGFNVYPQEVESVLSEHPGVLMAAVVGGSHHLTGEYPLAFVRIRDEEHPPEEREIIAFCKERLAHYKVPRKILFVSELPLSSVGKVLRRKLRDRYARGFYD